MLFQILQFLFSNILLFDSPKNLLDIFLEYIIISKYNFSFNYLMVYEIVNISLDLIKGYTAEIADNIYYFS
jgi:hypothetical protein